MEGEEWTNSGSTSTAKDRLEPLVNDWIEEESELLCDLAALDATFTLCGTREAHGRDSVSSQESGSLYADYLADREDSSSSSSRSNSSVLLINRREIRRHPDPTFRDRLNSFLLRHQYAMRSAVFLVATIAMIAMQPTKIEPPVDRFHGQHLLSSNDSSYQNIRDFSEVDNIYFTKNYELIFTYGHTSIRSSKWKNIIIKIERMLRRQNKEFGINTVRCFEEDSSCRKYFGVDNKTPGVVLKIKKSGYYVYRGRLSIDHVWAWIERLTSPVEIVYDLEDYYHKFMKYDVTFTAHFPFHRTKNGQRPHQLYSAFERVARKSMAGTPDSHRTRFFVVLNETLAEHLKIFIPGTVLFQSLLGRYEYLERGWEESDLSSYVQHWDRASYRVPFVYKGTHPTKWNKILSNRYFTKITNGTTIVLFTQYNPLYYPGNEDVTVFREIAFEYADCDYRPQWQRKQTRKMYHPKRYQAALAKQHLERKHLIEEDQRTAERVRRRETLQSCCSTLSSAVSLPSVCKCCQGKEKNECCLDSCLNVNGSSLMDDESCGLLKISKDGILRECCGLWRRSERPGSNALHEEERRQDMESSDALRSYLHSSLAEDEHQIAPVGIDAPKNLTVWKFGCKVDNPLRFVIVDTKRSPTLARRLGLNPKGTPRVALIEAGEERMSLMDWQFSRQSLRHFIASYYTGEMEWSLLNNGELSQHRRNDTDGDGQELHRDDVIRMNELSYEEFITLTRRTSLENDGVLFITGGASHPASGVLYHIVYETMQFFRGRNVTVDFYSFDVTASEIPYNFKMSRFPSLYFLPKDRPLDSYEFPKGLQFTTSNLVYYALAAFSDATRIETLLKGQGPDSELVKWYQAGVDSFSMIVKQAREKPTPARTLFAEGLDKKVFFFRRFVQYMRDPSPEHLQLILRAASGEDDDYASAV